MNRGIIPKTTGGGLGIAVPRVVLAVNTSFTGTSEKNSGL